MLRVSYVEKGLNSHGDIVGDDSLLLQLKFLERIGLEYFFGAWHEEKRRLDVNGKGRRAAYEC